MYMLSANPHIPPHPSYMPCTFTTPYTACASTFSHLSLLASGGKHPMTSSLWKSELEMEMSASKDMPTVTGALAASDS